MVPRSIILVLCLLPASARAGEADSRPSVPAAGAVERWSAQADRDAQTLPPLERARLLTALARAHLRQALPDAGRSLDLAGQAARQVDDPRQAADGFAQVAAAYVEAGRAEQALALVERIESPSLKARALCRLAEAHREAMDLEAMEKAFDQAKRSACAAAEPNERAEALLHLAAAQKRAGRPADSARTVLLAQQEAAAVIREPPPIDPGRFSERTILLRRVALAWAEAGQPDQASEAAKLAGIPPGQRPEDVRSVLPRFHQVTLLPEIAEIQYRNGDRDGAAASLDKAENYASSITYDDDAVPGLHRSEIFRGVAEGYIQIGDLESAVRCLGKARETASGTRLAWHRRQTAVMFARARDLDAALATAGEIAGRRDAANAEWLREQAFCYADLAEQQFKTGQPPRGRQCVDLALAAARRCPPSSTCDVLTRIAFVLLDGGDVPAGRKVLDDSIKALRDLDTLTRQHLAMRIAEGLARCDDLPAARRLIAQYVDPQVEWEALVPLHLLQVGRLKAMLTAGKLAQAKALADEHARDSRHLMGIARAFLEGGRPVEAMPYLERTIPTDNQYWPTDDLFRQIAAALAAAGRTAELDAWLARLKRPAIRAYVCLGGVEGFKP